MADINTIHTQIHIQSFFNYEKNEIITATTRYEDRFDDPTSLTAISKSRRTIYSEDVQNAINSRKRGILMPLFVRKNKDDETSKEFYFLGTMEHNGIVSLPWTFELDGMKTIEVVAAVIKREKEIFATQRGYGEFKDWWEFPGGKIELGETPQQALIREIKEELDADIKVGELIETIEWDYPTFHLTMHCFWCRLESEALHLNEHEASKWLYKESLYDVQWLPADKVLLGKIEAGL